MLIEINSNKFKQFPPNRSPRDFSKNCVYKLNCSIKSMMKAKYEGVISIISEVWYLKYIHVHHNMHPCGLNSKIKVQSVYDVT